MSDPAGPCVTRSESGSLDWCETHHRVANACTIADLRAKLKTAEDAVVDLNAWKHNATQQLLERSRQAEELMAAAKRRKADEVDREMGDQIIAEIARRVELMGVDLSATPPMFYPEAIQAALGRAQRDHDATKAQVAELRMVLMRVRAARTSGCSTGEAMSKAEAWCRDVLNLSPADIIALQQARRRVVDAVKAWRPIVPVDGDFHEKVLAMLEAVDSLERLEARR